jgi:Ca-activated chloride channel family protein
MSKAGVSLAVVAALALTGCGKTSDEPTKGEVAGSQRSAKGGKGDETTEGKTSTSESGKDNVSDQAGSGTTMAPSPRRAPPEPGQMDALMRKVDEVLDGKGVGGVRYAGYRWRRRGPSSKGAEKTLAPYFHRPGEDEKGVEDLPLKKTSAEVSIAGVIAQVKVRQVYKNEGREAIEAVYVFPASTRAAVHGMRMKIGDRIIEARIKERKQARKIYEQAKAAGKRASLLEQERPNVFTMNVANVMPGDVIEVELDYSELLVPEDQTYEFVYPTVVGPRFAGGADPKRDKWMKNPHLEAGKKEPYTFDIKVHVESPIGIKELSSPSHEVDVKYGSKSSADVSLKKSGGGNRDYVLRYRLAGDEIESGVLLYEGKDEKFFLMMMEPPKRVRKKEIPSREYVFVVDVSGSMFGFPLNTSKKVIRDLFKDLRPKDYFNVVLFAGASRLLSPKSLRATEGNLTRLLDVIDRQRGGGGTQLLAGLETAYALPKVKRKGVSRTIVVITDGYVGVEAKTFRMINKRLNEANVFAFGIGSSVNRGLIEGMASAGLGESFVVLSPEESETKADRFRKYIQSPVLTDIQVSYEGVSTYDVVPKSFPDLMAQRPLVAFGKYRGKPSGTVTVSGVTGKGAFKKSLELQPDQAGERNEPLRALWARKWVAKLMAQYHVIRENSEIKQAITSLGLSYNLLTKFTSFVAVDLEQVRKNGKVVTVRQPLPMPKGVSNKAIGSNKAMGTRVRRRLSRGSVRTRGAPSGPVSAARSADPLASLGAARPARPRARYKRKMAEQKAEATASSRLRVSSVKLSNVVSSRRSRYERTISRFVAYSRCLRSSISGGRKLSVKVTIKGSSVRISGTSGKVKRCLESIFVMVARMLEVGKAVDDDSKPVVIRLKIGG